MKKQNDASCSGIMFPEYLLLLTCNYLYVATEEHCLGLFLHHVPCSIAYLTHGTLSSIFKVRIILNLPLIAAVTVQSPSDLKLGKLNKQQALSVVSSLTFLPVWVNTRSNMDRCSSERDGYANLLNHSQPNDRTQINRLTLPSGPSSD